MNEYEVQIRHHETGDTDSVWVAEESREAAIEAVHDVYNDGWEVDSIEQGEHDGPPEDESMSEQLETDSRTETSGGDGVDVNDGIYKVTAEHPSMDAPRTVHVEGENISDAAKAVSQMLSGEGWEIDEVEPVAYETMKTTDTVRDDLTDPPENTGVAKDIDDGDCDSNRPVSADDILEGSAEVYRQKEGDYGEAWRVAGETLAMWSEELALSFDPTDPTQAVLWNLYMQRLHKLLRGFNLEFSDSEPANESPAESHIDESTYAAIHASYVKQQSDE